MLEQLTAWIADLKEKANEDIETTVFYFPGTKPHAFNIVGGWSDGFSEGFADLLYISKSNPSYAMSIKIVCNEASPDIMFDNLLEPWDEVEDEPMGPCVALELEDDPEELAKFILCEWERISKASPDKVSNQKNYI